jgi:transposase-like protein
MARSKIFSGNYNFFSSCPSCAQRNVLINSRPRNNKERIVKSFTWFAPYRCKSCGWRGYKSRISITGKNVKNGIIYLLLMVATAFIVYQVLKRIS